MARSKMTKRATKRGPKASVKASAKKNKASCKTKITKAAAKPNNAASMIKKMEKELMQAPAKIVAQINKDLKAIKQKENKAHNAANKNQRKVQAAESRVIAADKTSHTAAGKKRLKVAQKMHDALVKQQDKLNQHAETLTDNVLELQNKHAKFASIAKQLAQFDKDWAKNSKMNETAAQAKAKNKKAKQKDIEIPANIATIEGSQTNEVQTLFDEIILDESAEETAVG